MATPLVNEIHAPEGKTAVIGNNYGTVNLVDAKKLVPRFVDVPPLPPHPVVGRDGVLAELRARLCGADKVAAVSALDGLPGVGKTTVALRLAYDREILQHFCGGVLWAGLGPKGDATTALNRWSTALDVERRGPDADARARLLSLALQEKAQGEPVLLVLDDVWTWEQAAPFKSITFPGCAHLLTTRDAELARRFADRETRVETLPAAEAEAFVAARCPKVREADLEGLRKLVQAVGGLPLGLTLIAEELRRHEGQASWIQKAIAKLEAVEARLALEAREGRPGLEGVPGTLRAIVEMSVTALGEAEQAAFAALGAFAPRPADFGRDAVLAVWEAGEEEGDARLRLLVDRALVEVAGEGRFAVHQVLGAVAEARLGEERGARERHAGFYRRLMDADREDWQRIEGELAQIRGAWGWLSGRDDVAVEVLAHVYAIRIFHTRRGLQEERLAWLERGLKAAGSLKQPGDEATLLNNIGAVHDELGEKARALEYYEQALPLRRAVGDRAGEGTTLNNIGMVHAALGEKARALECYEQALPLRRAVGDRAGEGTTLNNIGMIHAALGEKARALECYEQALPLFCAVGNRAGEAATLNNIGMVHDALGEKARALEYLEQALPLRRAVGDRAGEAVTLFNIAQIHDDHGRTDEAIALMDRVVELDAAVQHPDLESDRAVLAGMRAKRDAPPPRFRALFIILALALAAAAAWHVFSK